MATPFSATKTVIEETETSSYQSFDFESDASRLNTKEANLQRENHELEEEIKSLRREISSIEKIVSESSESYAGEPYKMYGDLRPGDTTHNDIQLQYQNFFKEASKNMPRRFTWGDKYKIWQMCADLFQTCFDMQREDTVAKMKSAMMDSLIKDFSKCTVDESTHDLHCALKKIIAEVNPEDIKSKVKDKVPHLWSEDVFDFVFNMIQELDPIHYKSFLDKGDLQEKFKIN